MGFRRAPVQKLIDFSGPRAYRQAVSYSLRRPRRPDETVTKLMKSVEK